MPCTFHSKNGNIAIDTHADVLISINAILERLAPSNPRMLRVIECRFFAGYTEDETAETLGVSTKTIEREWREAKDLLRTALATTR